MAELHHVGALRARRENAMPTPAIRAVQLVAEVQFLLRNRAVRNQEGILGRMPNSTTDADRLAMYFLDLRGEYEAELRLLTEVQRQLERFRTARTDAVRNRARDILVQQMRLLGGANQSIGSVLNEAGPLLAALQAAPDNDDAPDGAAH